MLSTFHLQILFRIPSPEHEDGGLYPGQHLIFSQMFLRVTQPNLPEFSFHWKLLETGFPYIPIILMVFSQ